MKLISLSITNMRKIRAAELEFDGQHLVEIRGRNGAGKSTVIDSILYLLKGSKDIPAGVVTTGAEKGVVVGQLGDYTVRRVIDTEGKSTLTVESQTGKVPSPQAFLDKLAGQFLDPEYFRNLSSKDKRALVLSYAGVDFSEIDAKIAEAEQSRLLLGREMKALGALPMEPEKVEEVSVADLIEERKTVEAFNAQQRVRSNLLHDTVKHVRDRMISGLQRDFSTFDELTAFVKKMVDEYGKGVVEAQAKLPLPEPDKSTEEIDAKLAGIEEINRKARAYSEWCKKRDAIAAKKVEYDAADAEVARLREEKHGMVAGARMPMKGLEITDTGLAFNGVSDENWSDSEALKIALNVAIAYSGDLKAVYIKRGEALDNASLEKLRVYAEAKDFQVVIEIVDDSYAKQGEGVVYISEGEVQ